MQLYRSVTDGLSAFFVLCFSKINVLAFAILTPVEVEHFDTTDGKWKEYERRVHFQGDMHFFQGHHLPHAISAIAVVTMVIIMQTIILLFRPLVLCVLGKLGLGQSRSASSVLNILFKFIIRNYL